MAEKKAPYVPTRTCPHPWCKRLHLVPVPFVIAILAFDLWHNWRWLVFLVIVIFLGYWVPKVVHFKPRRSMQPVDNLPAKISLVMDDLRESPSAIDLELQDARYSGTGWRTLEVRKGWARVAVACDLVMVTIVGLSVTAMFADPAAKAQQSEALRLNGDLLLAVLIGAALFGFNLYAHKKATTPRKPKRAWAWVPGFLRTET